MPGSVLGARYTETSEENKAVQNRVRWCSKNRELWEYRRGVPSSAWGGQDSPLGGRLELSPTGPVFTRRVREKGVLGGTAHTELQDWPVGQ